MGYKVLVLGTCAISALLPIASAAAQESGEIIVTARKRQESILRVPVVETVLTAAQIERAQIKDLFDVSRKTTGLQLGTAPTETGTLISVRGFGTTAVDPGVDQSVSLNLDGLQLTQGLAYSVGVFDMAQVEILKGPQALFFGKASPAGVVAIRTNDPGDKLEVIGRTGYEFEGREWRNELILSTPVSDSFGIRLAGMYSHFGGFFKNVETANLASGALPMPKRFGETKTLFLRGTALFKPSSDFTARLKVNYTRDRQQGAQPGQLTSCPEGTFDYLPTVGIPLPSFFSDNEDCKGDRKVAIVGMDPAAFPAMRPINGGRPASYITQKFGTLELDYNVRPDITITSVTGYYNLKATVGLNCFNAGGAAPSCMTEKYLRREDFTQEVRLNSEFQGPVNLSLGGFYQDGNITDDEILPTNIRYGLPPAFFKGTQDVDIKALSFFGQLRWNVASDLEIAGGARWNHEKRRNRPTTVDIFGATTGVPGAILVDQVAQPKLNSKNWSPELTITYTPTDDLTFFGSLKQAYKSGSYNISSPVQPGQNQSFGDEKVQGGEIGLKSRLADRQINFNLAGYFYKLKDMQVGIVQPFVGGLPVLLTLNAGKSEIYGVEADFTYRPNSVPGLEIFGAINYNHARFTSFPNAPCLGGQSFAEGCNAVPAPVTTLTDPLHAFTDPQLFGGAPFRYTATDLTGTRLARAPDWSGTFGVHYEMPVGNEMKLGLGGDAQFSSKYVGILGTRKDFFQKGYAMVNANISLKGPEDSWEIAVIGNNLSNKLIASARSSTNYSGGLFFGGSIFGGPNDGPAGDDEVFSYLNRGRELWIRLTLRPASLF